LSRLSKIDALVKGKDERDSSDHTSLNRVFHTIIETFKDDKNIADEKDSNNGMDQNTG